MRATTLLNTALGIKSTCVVGVWLRAANTSSAARMLVNLEDERVYSLTIDAAAVYWSTNTAIMKVAR